MNEREPMPRSERVIDIASWVGVGSMGVIIVVGILAGVLYVSSAGGPMLLLGGAVLASFVVLGVAVSVAAVVGGLARRRP